MSLKLVFLGRLEDVAGGPERMIDTVPSVAAVLMAVDPDLATALRGEKVKIALNGTVLHTPAAAVLKDGDELAFLPPVSGG